MIPDETQTWKISKVWLTNFNVHPKLGQKTCNPKISTVLQVWLRIEFMVEFNDEIKIKNYLLDDECP